MRRGERAMLGHNTNIHHGSRTAREARWKKRRQRGGTAGPAIMRSRTAGYVGKTAATRGHRTNDHHAQPHSGARWKNGSNAGVQHGRPSCAAAQRGARWKKRQQCWGTARTAIMCSHTVGARWKKRRQHGGTAGASIVAAAQRRRHVGKKAATRGHSMAGHHVQPHSAGHVGKKRRQHGGTAWPAIMHSRTARGTLEKRQQRGGTARTSIMAAAQRGKPVGKNGGNARVQHERPSCAAAQRRRHVGKTAAMLGHSTNIHHAQPHSGGGPAQKTAASPERAAVLLVFSMYCAPGPPGVKTRDGRQCLWFWKQLLQ